VQKTPTPKNRNREMAYAAKILMTIVITATTTTIIAEFLKQVRNRVLNKTILLMSERGFRLLTYMKKFAIKSE
jgi:hypothetical protein